MSQRRLNRQPVRQVVYDNNDGNDQNHNVQQLKHGPIMVTRHVVHEQNEDELVGFEVIPMTDEEILDPVVEEIIDVAEISSLSETAIKSNTVVEKVEIQNEKDADNWMIYIRTPPRNHEEEFGQDGKTLFKGTLTRFLRSMMTTEYNLSFTSIQMKYLGGLIPEAEVGYVCSYEKRNIVFIVHNEKDGNDMYDSRYMFRDLLYLLFVENIFQHTLKFDDELLLPLDIYDISDLIPAFVGNIEWSKTDKSFCKRYTDGGVLNERGCYEQVEYSINCKRENWCSWTGSVKDKKRLLKSIEDDFNISKIWFIDWSGARTSFEDSSSIHWISVAS